MTETTPPFALDVRVAGLGVRFATPGGSVEAIGGLDLDIEAGSFTAVIGPNGCGKSTLLRVLAGLLAPTSGSVRVGGAPPRAGDGRTALVFQQPRLVPWRATIDNVALPLELAGVPPSARRQRAREALGRVGLAGAADLRPRALSGGMAQRAALARALVTDPSLLLLDEPFSALDALTREAFDAELLHLWRARQRTVVLVTHSVSEALALADRIVVMRGRPGAVARVIPVGLPRPRPIDLAASPEAAALAVEVRAALAASHPEELEPWTTLQEAAP